MVRDHSEIVFFSRHYGKPRCVTSFRVTPETRGGYLVLKPTNSTSITLGFSKLWGKLWISLLVGFTTGFQWKKVSSEPESFVGSQAV